MLSTIFIISSELNSKADISSAIFTSLPVANKIASIIPFDLLFSIL